MAPLNQTLQSPNSKSVGTWSNTCCHTRHPFQCRTCILYLGIASPLSESSPLTLPMILHPGAHNHKRHRCDLGAKGYREQNRTSHRRLCTGRRGCEDPCGPAHVRNRPRDMIETAGQLLRLCVQQWPQVWTRGKPMSSMELCRALITMQCLSLSAYLSCPSSQ